MGVGRLPRGHRRLRLALLLVRALSLLSLPVYPTRILYSDWDKALSSDGAAVEAQCRARDDNHPLAEWVWQDESGDDIRRSSDDVCLGTRAQTSV